MLQICLMSAQWWKHILCSALALVLRRNTSPRKILGCQTLCLDQWTSGRERENTADWTGVTGNIKCFIFTIGVAANRWDVFYRGQYKIMISHLMNSLQRLYSAREWGCNVHRRMEGTHFPIKQLWALGNGISSCNMKIS